MNEIKWREWTDDAFNEAAETGKPVLLAIGAVWCHWCHVMDRTTYSDERVIELVNDRYIPVRVDNDREPDINNRYNMGGWPTVAFLTPAGDVITGGTYMPPAQMASLLERLASAYAENREEVVRQASEATTQHAGAVSAAVQPGVAKEDVDRVLGAVESYYDTIYGGFGHGQKFPMISVLELLMLTYERTGREEYIKMLTGTLDGMLAGDLFDPVEGGMFRYATQRDWSVPHYEKMLTDNAGIAQVLLNAYRRTGKQTYLDTAGGVFRYLDRTLLDQQTGLYFGSQDADEEYYTADADGRAKLTPPRVDTAAYTDTNAQAALAWLKLWTITGDAGARERATRIVDVLNSFERGQDGTVPHFFENGETHTHGLLADQVYLAFANLVVFEATGTRSYLDRSISLLQPLDDSFRAPSGAYYDISVSRAAQRRLARTELPLEENSLLAVLLIALSAITGDSGYNKRAKATLSALSTVFEHYGIMAADYAIGVTIAHARPVLVSVEKQEDDQAAELIRTSLATCGLRCAVKPEFSEEAGSPTASVCVGTTCRTRTSSPQELEEALREAMAWI